MSRWFFGLSLVLLTGVLSACGQDELRKEKATLASSSARLNRKASVLDARESSLDKVRSQMEAQSIAESESKEVTESQAQAKLDRQSSSASAKIDSQAASVSEAAESVSQKQITSPAAAVTWVKQQRGEQDSTGKITWQAGTTGEKNGQPYFAVQGQQADHKTPAELDLLVLSSGEIVTRDSAAGKALTE
ncbi:hypothetical protein [Loigolactobacillus binensis]|uniref:Lipoprotein n=1 Tax=Loigolactobacillus binensis TaxID=2559922 RepID=A0ABW3EG87_9LACO|nr:hypothetical protein [Loigolactobacillus binensis]